MREIGPKLQARARELGLTDAEVARRLDLSQARYSNYVNGNREPDLATFARICKALAITPNALLGFEAAPAVEADLRLRVATLLEDLEPGRLELALALITTLATHREVAASTPALPTGRSSRPTRTTKRDEAAENRNQG